MTDIAERTDDRLPAAVRDLAERLGVTPRNKVAGVRLTQTGQMKRSLEARSWMAFTATQTISTQSCAFDWRAKAGPLGLIRGRDALKDGQGRFDITALGMIPIAKAAHTPALLRGELMRYLAEIAWAPHAIVCNQALRWRIVDTLTLSVSAGEGEAASEVLLTLDCRGRIAGAFAPDRPRSASQPILPTPWRGLFSDYREHDGIWLPFAGEVAWEIEGKSEPYWRCRIDTWAAVA